jgi:hypothetical protein
MPDWREVVRQRLAGLALEPEDTSQVFEELAGHLEEKYQFLLREGVSEEDAARRTLEQVSDWQELKQMIESARRKETTMPKRVAQFWFPAFLTLLLSMALLALIEKFGPNPWASPMPGGRLRMTPVVVVYVSWLLFLPFIGAMGAFLSRRAGAPVRVTMASIVFPVLCRAVPGCPTVDLKPQCHELRPLCSSAYRMVARRQSAEGRSMTDRDVRATG